MQCKIVVRKIILTNDCSREHLRNPRRRIGPEASSERAEFRALSKYLLDLHNHSTPPVGNLPFPFPRSWPIIHLFSSADHLPNFSPKDCRSPPLPRLPHLVRLPVHFRHPLVSFISTSSTNPSPPSGYFFMPLKPSDRVCMVWSCTNTFVGLSTIMRLQTRTLPSLPYPNLWMDMCARDLIQNIIGSIIIIRVKSAHLVSHKKS